MTIGKLRGLILQAGGNDETKILSDSGWECSETECDGVMYHEGRNEVVLQQSAECVLSVSKYSGNDIHIDSLRNYGGYKILTASDLIGTTFRVNSPHTQYKDFVFDGTLPTEDQVKVKS